jgi:AraC family transcriptional regulator
VLLKPSFYGNTLSLIWQLRFNRQSDCAQYIFAIKWDRNFIHFRNDGKAEKAFSHYNYFRTVRRMGYGEDMARCRTYIEEHLSEEISIRALAERTGYSFYHFCHVFRSCNGMSPGEYIRQKRLSQAALALSCGRPVTEVAMDFGYGTHSGFTRAFSRRFGITPSEYKKGVLNMTPEIKMFPAFSAIGYVLEPEGRTDPRENGAYWLGKDFSSVSKEEYAKVTYPGYTEIGAWIHPEIGRASCRERV